MTNPTIAEIAGKLTAAQKREICGEMRSIGKPAYYILTGDWINLSSRAIQIVERLRSAGLIQHSKFGALTLTDLGLAVRAYLQEQER